MSSLEMKMFICTLIGDDKQFCMIPRPISLKTPQNKNVRAPYISQIAQFNYYLPYLAGDGGVYQVGYNYTSSV